MEQDMEVTKKLLSELQNRLKVGNRRGVHLNAIPARSRYKFDLNRLAHVDKNLPNNFIDALLTKRPLKFKVSWKKSISDLSLILKEDQNQLVKIANSFENLINQTETIESEKGINTFGFGFPLLVRRDKADNKLTVAPILIWSLRIKRINEFNTWEIQRTVDDPIYINEVLINHLYSDSKIETNPISSEMMDDGLISKDELIDICVSLIESINNNTPNDIRETFSQKLNNIISIPDKKHYEKLHINSNNAIIDFGGLFSIFEVQKQSIITDYGKLLDDKAMKVNLEKMDQHYFQPISSVETDPSQQSILHSLESTRNILIQGPPGTGKSQSLTAILVNALENHRKTIVVCEKRTALEVLHNVLNEKGLNYQCVLIKDSIKDRKTAVNSVRDRVDNSSYRKYSYSYSKESLDLIINKLKSLIDSINKKHKKLGKEILSNSTWPHVVGTLLGELNNFDEDCQLEIDSLLQFEYNSTELNKLLDLIQKGQTLYSEYIPNEKYSFLNFQKLSGDNPYIVEQKIEKDFKTYKKYIDDENSEIQKILKKYKNTPDFFDVEKTDGLFYQIQSVFSKEKKRILQDQDRLSDNCLQLANSITKDNWNRLPLKIGSSKEIIDSTRLLIEAKEKYYANKNDLFTAEFNWFQYYNNLTVEKQLLIDKLKEKQNWRKVFLIYYLNSALLNTANAELPTNDNEHKELSNSLGGIEKEQIKYIKEYWFSKQIDATREFNQNNHNLSVENLYNKRSSRKHSRLSLRQIVKFDINLFTTFFPIILTTPDVCSNLFSGKNEYFDIVMFDEASQLRLEDNLPALLKGKQIIIAGDEHQMPPSNYFSKIFDGTIDNEDDVEEEDEIVVDRDNILLSCESLLDFATELSFDKKHLDFHYRSRHPYLIDFSNHAFYNKRLKPLPTTFSYTPIKYVQVAGSYHNHCNEAEAETIISILKNNINRLPNGNYPTVGIATFNIAQRNLIKSKIIERRKFERFAEFNNKILELEENGLFVKNLENIQGDERDVIILSTTYGIGKNGKFAQRFGPVNHKKGYKLLNVIITRAKYKIYVCTSIPENIFLSYNDYLIAEQSNNRRGVFFAYLTYAKAVSENNNKLKQAVLNSLLDNTAQTAQDDYLNEDLESPFEEEVYRVLTNNFDEQKLTSQLQFAGTKIDIVYDSTISGVPKIAIECDGAAYHNSEEAYLYDHHRQKILEANGFVFHRIWSTNWWRSPERETKKLIDFINSIEHKQKMLPKPIPKLSLAFTDNISGLENGFDKLWQVDKEQLHEAKTNSIVLADSGKNELNNITIKCDSKVRLKNLNDGEVVIIQLVDIVEISNTPSNSIQEIHSKSPLAKWIIGRRVGEIVKLGELDNYVEVLEVEK